MPKRTHITNKTVIQTLAAVLLLIAGIGGFFIYKDAQNESRQRLEAYVKDQMAGCYQKAGASQCYKQVAANLLSSYTLPRIMEIFKANEKKPEFFSNCHTVAHYMGQLEYKRLKSVEAVFSEASHACLAGTYHGTIEGYFIEKGIINAPNSEIKSEVAQICGQRENYERRQQFKECNHGLGHATMFLADYDLPLALDLCDALGSQNERQLCYSGALMANGDAFLSSEHPTKYVKADDLLYPCPILKEHQQGQCYTYGVLTRFQNDLEQSIAVCLMIPGQFQKECFKTLGRDRTMISADPAELRSQCAQIQSSTFRNDCMEGTAYYLVIRFGTASTLAYEYCRTADSSFKADCYRNILKGAKDLTSSVESLATFCGQIKEEEYTKQCLNSIKET